VIARLLAWGVIILNIGACIGYCVAGDYRKAVYWGAAAALNLSITL
jgi:hypothetical protein